MLEPHAPGRARDDDCIPPLPIGRLRRSTIVEAHLADHVHHRVGPWTELVGEDSRLVRVGELEELLFDTGWQGDQDPHVPREVPGSAAAEPPPARRALPRRASAPLHATAAPPPVPPAPPQPTFESPSILSFSNGQREPETAQRPDLGSQERPQSS